MTMLVCLVFGYPKRNTDENIEQALKHVEDAVEALKADVGTDITDSDNDDYYDDGTFQ